MQLIVDNSLVNKQVLKKNGPQMKMLLIVIFSAFILCTRAEFNESNPEVFVAAETAIWRMNLDGSNKRLFASAVNATTLDFHNGKHLVFWADIAAHKIYSKDMFDESAEAKVVIEGSEDWKPRAIAVDYLHDNIYVIDQGGLKIDMFSLDGTKTAEYLKNNITQPDQGDWSDTSGPSTVDIAVDPINGYVFFGEYNRVWKATLNFSEVTYMAHKSFISGIMIDPFAEKFYYTDIERFLWEYTYGGERLNMINAYYVDHPVDFFRGTGVSPRSIAKFDGTLFYLDRRQNEFPGLQRLDNYYNKMIAGDFHNGWTVRIRHPSLQKQN